MNRIIGNDAYQHQTTNQWSQQAVEKITTSLVKLNKPYKFIGEFYFSLVADPDFFQLYLLVIVVYGLVGCFL